MTPSIFEINGIQYTYSKLDTITQIHVCRRLLPFYNQLSQIDLSDIIQKSLPLQLLASIPQEDLDYVIHAVLPFVQRKEGASWQRIYNGGARRFTFEDISGGGAIDLVFSVVMEYLPGFFQGVAPVIYGTPREQTTIENTQP